MPVTGSRQRLPRQSLSVTIRVGLAILVSLLALLASTLLRPLLIQTTFVMFLGAVAVSAYYGGFWPAMLSTAIASLASACFFMYPYGSPTVLAAADLIVLASFVAVSLLVAWLGELQRRNEALLADQHEWWRASLASVGDAVITTDVQARVTFMNAVAERLTGWRLADADGRPLDRIFRIIDESTRRPVENPVAKVLQRGAVVGLANHTILIAQDGTQRPIEDSGAPIRDRHGRVLGVVLMFRDVTERRRTEQALRQSEERFRAIADTAPVMIWMSGTDAACTFFNQPWLEFRGRRLEQELGNGWADGVHPDDRQPHLAAYLTAFGERAPFRMECRLRSADGSYRWVLDTGIPRYLPDGGFLGYIGSVVDIDERKASEERLISSLREKDALLVEVHHRVKSNLQVISSLLNLQTEYVRDRHTLALFKASQDRVRSIALAHEKLNQSSDFSKVDAAEYIRSLTAHVFQSYGAREAISLRLDIGSAQFSIETAIAVGLIMHELVSNALKHAFPDGRAGEIRVHLRRQDDGACRLIVEDTGVGLPLGFDVRQTETLGLRLVNGLVEQLGGTLDLEPGAGTRFALNFAGSRQLATA